nr:MAG TPA: hypothetical protein [Caudoviricetes sp.]
MLSGFQKCVIGYPQLELKVFPFRLYKLFR